jgi:hypothetical protein
VPGVLNRRINNLDIRDSIYTVNHFYFEDAEWADVFYDQLNSDLVNARNYENNNEVISKPQYGNAKTIIILYGKEI